MSNAYVFDAVRVPFGRYGGALAGVRPDDLGAHVVKSLLDRHDVDPERIDDVMFGNANGAGEDNRNVARMAVLLAGLPTSIPGTTINRLCGSSLDAAIQASRAVETGDADLILVGGVESMSRAPWVVLKPEKGFPSGPQTMHSTTLGWRMVNPNMPEQWTISLGESTEKLAGIYGIGPVEAANRALARAGIGWGDLDLVELNEAFAAQSLACLREWKELDPDKLNVSGGAIALGHPLGASGARILGTLAHGLHKSGGRWGLAAICIGVGQGLAMVVEAA